MWETTIKMPSQNVSNAYIQSVEVLDSQRSSIEIEWRSNIQTSTNVLGYRVHYQKLASSYVQYGPRLPPTDDSYNVENLVPDTYYKICLSMLRNGTSSNQQCITASTQSWDLPVSVGSSIGAVIALAMIVLLILMIRCRSLILCSDKSKEKSNKNDTVSSNCYDDVFEFSPNGENDDQTENMLTNQEPYQTDNINEHETNKRKKEKESGAIPKVPRSHCHRNSKKSCSCDKNYSRHPNGFIPKREDTRACTSGSGDYHDNSIILHVSNTSEASKQSEIDDSSSEDSFIIPSDIVSTKENQKVEVSESTERLNILLAFPNDDSSSDSFTNEYDLTDMTAPSRDSARITDIPITESSLGDKQGVC